VFLCSFKESYSKRTTHEKIFLTALSSLFCVLLFSQNIPDYAAIKLDTKEDYNASANKAALEAANYLLSTPIDSKNTDRLKSMQYIIKWMTGTPDYSFSLDEQATKFAKNNTDFLGLYMAAMAKYVLENNADAKNQNAIKLNAVKLIITYAKEPKNSVKLNSELKKAIEADANGKLSEYLKL